MSQILKNDHQLQELLVKIHAFEKKDIDGVVLCKFIVKNPRDPFFAAFIENLNQRFQNIKPDYERKCVTFERRHHYEIDIIDIPSSHTWEIHPKCEFFKECRGAGSEKWDNYNLCNDCYDKCLTEYYKKFGKAPFHIFKQNGMI